METLSYNSDIARQLLLHLDKSLADDSPEGREKVRETIIYLFHFTSRKYRVPAHLEETFQGGIYDNKRVVKPIPRRTLVSTAIE